MMSSNPSRRRRRKPSSWRRQLPISLLATSRCTATGLLRESASFFVPLHTTSPRQRSAGIFQRERWPIEDVSHSSLLALRRSPLQQQRHLKYGVKSTRQRSSVGDYDEGSEEESNNNDGVYLDEETYLRAEDTLLRSDGSLNFNKGPRKQGVESSLSSSSSSYPPMPRMNNNIYRSAAEGLFSPPPSYSYAGGDYVGDDGGELSDSQRQLSDEEKLYRAVTDIESGAAMQQTGMDAEELHRQVMAEERTHLEQSEEFRRSLSSPYEDRESYESPTAKERREVFDEENEKVLAELMKEIEEMEGMAISRDEATRRAGADERTNGGVCPECGLTITPDMLQRAETMDIVGGGGVRTKEEEKGGAATGGGALCATCRQRRLRTNQEARVRLGAGESGYEYASARTLDRASPRKRWNRGNSNYRGGTKGRDDKGGGSGVVQGIDTSSLFRVPKGYGGKSKSNAESGSSVEPDRSASNGAPSGRRRRTPPRRTPQNLGGMELAKRMQREQQPSGSNDDASERRTSRRTNRSSDAQTTVRTLSKTQRPGREAGKQITQEFSSVIESSEETVGVESDASSNLEVASVPNANNPGEPPALHDGEQWLKVEDPGTKKMFYWNTETGEMRKTLDQS